MFFKMLLKSLAYNLHYYTNASFICTKPKLATDLNVDGLNSSVVYWNLKLAGGYALHLVSKRSKSPTLCKRIAESANKINLHQASIVPQ